MEMLRTLWLTCAWLGLLLGYPVLADIEYNTINSDGSYQFRYIASIEVSKIYRLLGICLRYFRDFQSNQIVYYKR